MEGRGLACFHMLSSPQAAGRRHKVAVKAGGSPCCSGAEALALHPALLLSPT